MHHRQPLARLPHDDGGCGGWPDLYGERLQITQVGLADELAAAASIIMGQAGEGLPVVHLRGVPYGARSGTARELIRPIDQDLFR